MAHQLVGYYTIADDKDKTLKVLRSYQYFAVSKLQSTDNDDRLIVTSIQKMSNENCADAFNRVVDETTQQKENL